jgi:hypothetical protein
MFSKCYLNYLFCSMLKNELGKHLSRYLFLDITTAKKIIQIYSRTTFLIPKSYQTIDQLYLGAFIESNVSDLFSI